ncbi:MAG TPA: hypothetical protein VFT87_04035 [Candidatus Saccharimonadales bacterium]|nr:hypothetical protein [Candidatus Saccharimonadales bacterium]
MLFSKVLLTPLLPSLVCLVAMPWLLSTCSKYRPPASSVTTEVAVPLPAACACGGSFDQSKTTTHVRYEEDIPLPEVTPSYQAKLVTKYVIERGRYLACGSSATGGSPTFR